MTTPTIQPAVQPAKASHEDWFDVAIVGGGLAGLALSIQLAQLHYKVLVIEKESYPFHRVCGEYISFECWNFLEGLGYPLSDMNLPAINSLLVSAPGGRSITHPLPLGGFGISRYKLDAELAAIARQQGVVVHEKEKVTDINFHDDQFTVQCSSHAIKSKVVAAAFGKRSNLDIKWQRPFVKKEKGKLVNYIGVKYHIKTSWPADTIALHNFSEGYCGLSQVENNEYCLCYLTTSRNLRANGSSIQEMEKRILQRNPFLRKIFAESEFLWSEPVTIAQVSFHKKQQVEDHVLMIGDAAGMITPLCGNGMSMALHGSKLAAESIGAYLQSHISRAQMEATYVTAWTNKFGNRLRAGRWIQRMFGRPWLTNIFITILKPFPRVVGWMIRQTHGEPF